MKIDISSSPYFPEFSRGYVIIHKKESRKFIVLVRDDNSKFCTSYARYVMSVALGRRLLKTEQVDHIDEDKTNDELENLQILTQAENIAKNRRHRLKKSHGTSSMYKSGCRCCKCTDYMKRARNKWYAEHKKEFNEKRRAKRSSKTH